MKNFINYFYNLNVDNIQQRNDIYKLIINNITYMLVPFYGDINSIYRIYSFLMYNHIYCHEIIFNKDKQMITIFKDKEYVLLKIINRIHEITLKEINIYNIFVHSEKKCNWYNLWCERIDYYEYQVNQFGKKYPVIRESFSYYNGLCENAISLFYKLNLNNLNMYICHKKMNKNIDANDFYNPLNFILDVRVRDVCEYFKMQFFKNKNNFYELYNYIESSNLSYEEAMLFLIRLIYPSYYFDLYDDVIQNKVSDDKLYYYINNVVQYEDFLRKTYTILQKKYQIPEIEWLKK